MSPPAEFTLLAQNKIVGFPDGNVLSWCPKMDLLAVSMNFTSIWVFRLDGERVYSINNRAKILELCWSRSGKFFAVSGSDKTVKVYDSNNGSLVNKFAANAELDISLVSWESIDVDFSISREEKVSPFHGIFDVDILKHMPKLAHEVDSADANSISLDANSPYTSVSVTDTADNDAIIDYLLVINANRWMSFTFNNLLTVTDIPLPPDTHILQHAMAPDLFSQFFLVEDQSHQLHLQELCLKVRESKRRSRIFSTIRYSSQLISIMNHIQDQFKTIQTEAKDFISLFDRHLSNYKDSLYEGTDLTTNFPSPQEVEDTMVGDLGEMLLTGLIPGSMKDYWLNQFGERGLLRLSTVGNTVYDNVRKTIITQLILACEKIVILLGNLEGFAKEADCLKEDYCGISQESISKSITCTTDLMKGLFDFIWRLNEEHEGFNQFLNWCQVEVIEKLSKEDSDPKSFFQEHPTMEFKASGIMEYFDKHLLAPVFLSIIEEQGANEVLKKQEITKPSLNSSIITLAEELKSSLVGFENHLRDLVSFSDPIPLNVTQNSVQTGESLCDINLFDDAKVVTAANENVLSIIYIQDGLAAPMKLVLPGPIVSHKVIAKDKFLVLFGSQGAYRLDLVQAYAPNSTIDHKSANVLKSLAFDQGSSVKEPMRLVINGLKNDTHMIGMVLDSSKKDYVVFEI